MRNWRALSLLLVGMFFAFLPMIAAAQGLVPCDGIHCQACDLISLAQNVINFLLSLSIPLAIGLFAYAGVLYFTSATNPSNINKARGIFKNALIGMLIALGAYLIVNTILHAILKPEFSTGWNTVQCSSDEARAERMYQSIGQLFRETINGVIYGPARPSTVVQGTGGTSGGTNNGGTTNGGTGGGTTVGGTGSWWTGGSLGGGSVTSGGRGVSTCAPGNIACSVSTLVNFGLSLNEAAAMSCIAVTESTGDPYTHPSDTGACGLFQITNKTSAGNWRNPQYHGLGCSVATSCNDPFCNAQTAVIMFEYNGYQPWTGIKPDGTHWNPNAVKCVQTYDPQTTRRLR